MFDLKISKEIWIKNAVTWGKVHLPNHHHKLQFVGGEELPVGQETVAHKEKVSEVEG